MQIEKKGEESNTVPDIKVHQERAFFENNNIPRLDYSNKRRGAKYNFRLLVAAVN